MDFRHTFACFLAFVALICVVESHGRFCHSHRRNECPEKVVQNWNVTRYYRCPCEEASSTEEDSGDSNDDVIDWRDFSNRRRHRSLSIRISWRNRRRESCWCETSEIVPITVCEDKCCEGWTWNHWGRCKKRVAPKPVTPAPITAICQNGGKLYGSRCICKPGFIGKECETETCKYVCTNGGRCDKTQSPPVCVCPPAFIGDRCETPVCNCMNSGKCVNDNGLATCLCKEGFVGDRCEYAEKNGTCPTTKNQQCVNHSCKQDNECMDEQKCCLTSCGNQCLAPAEATCNYGGVVARLGESFSPTPCEQCVCVSPGMNHRFGGATCAVYDCPPMERYCSHPIFDADKCCPTCGDLPTTSKPVITERPYTQGPPTTSRPITETPDPYTVPRFTNCPRKPIFLSVNHLGHQVTLPKLLVAETYWGQKLKVKYSQSVFKPGREEENIHVVLATSWMDERQNFANCTFFVRVKDKHPPIFESCPSSVEVDEGNAAIWEEPKAKDNVGIADKPYLLTKVPKDIVFTLGEHVVMYRVEDLEGNEAICEFLVRVVEEGRADLLEDDDHHNPMEPPQHRPEDDSSQTLTIALCAGVGLLVLAIVVVLFICCKRRKFIGEEQRRRHHRRHDHHGHHHGHHDHHHGHHHGPEAYDNNIYNVPVGISQLPEYDDISIKDAPPVYTEKDVYDEIKSTKSGLDNPTYDVGEVIPSEQNKSNDQKK